MKSFAYFDSVDHWDDKNSIVLDFLSSELETNLITDFPQLTHLRAARCDKLSDVTISNCPLLLAVDLSLCANLKKLTIQNCPKLKALDLSYCGELEIIQGGFPNLIFLSIPGTRILEYPQAPNLKFLDIAFVSNEIQTVSFYPNLEFLNMFSQWNKDISLKWSTSAKKLKVMIAPQTVFTFDEKRWFSSIEILNLENAKIKGNPADFGDIYIVTDHQTYGTLPKPKSLAYLSAQRLLYGPWPIPPTDLEKVILPKPLPGIPQLPEIAADAIAGSVFGMAIMDMIGLGSEFCSKSLAQIHLNSPFSICWTHPTMSMHTTSFIRGTSTDDTSQAVLIMRSLVYSNSHPVDVNGTSVFEFDGVFVDLKDFSNRLIDWKNIGHIEHKHKGGLGMGLTVRQVLSQPNFLENPIDAARMVWESMGKSLASNGSVMRTGPIGCFYFWNTNLVIEVAKLFGRSTHYDPRCVFATVAISMIISQIIQERCGMTHFDLDKTIEEAIEKVEGAADYIDDIRKYSNARQIEELELGTGQIGYTLKTYGVAIWALRSGLSFLDALIAIVKEGGDADTNGAVAGSVLGAKYGWSSLPQECLEFMFDKTWLHRELAQFMSLMGLVPPHI